MKSTIINFIEFDKNPFNKGIELFCYKPIEQVEYKDVGHITRKLRYLNQDNPIFHYDKNIYSLFKITNDIELFTAKYQETNSITLKMDSLNDEYYKKLGEYLIGNIILNRILRDPETTWKTSESANYMIYQIIKFQENYLDKKFKQEIAIYQGFIIRPTIFLPSKIGFFIDCKSKIFYKNTLTDKNLLSMVESSDFGYLIDMCPNRECPQMKSSFSECYLSTPNSGRKFFKKNEYTSENTWIELSTTENQNDENSEIIEEDFDDDWDIKFPDIDEKNKDEYLEQSNNKIKLIDYHKRENVCPEGLLSNSLDPNQNSIKIMIYDKKYDYPPERLRPTVLIKRLRRDDRSYIMNQFILPPFQRLRKIERFLLDVCSIIKYEKDNNSYLFQSSNPIYYQIDSPPGKFYQLNIPELKLAEDHYTVMPSIEIEEFLPFDIKTRKSELSILSLYFGQIWDEEYQKLKKYNFKSEIEKYFKFKNVTINNFNGTIKENANFEKFKETVNDFDCILIFHGEYRIISDEDEATLNFLYKNKKPIQGINVSKFIEKLEPPEFNYFRNILLGLYAKCGYLPWVIRKDEIKSEYFIGLNIKSSNQKKEKFYSMSLYRNNGILVKIYYEKCTIENFSNRLKEKITLILSNLNSESLSLKLYFLLLGKCNDEIKELIGQLVHDGGHLCYFFEIYQNIAVRLFEEVNKKIKQVRPGTCYVFPTENEAYFTSIEPVSGTVQPIKIKLNPCKNEEVLTISDIQKVFDLTQSYIGYVNYRIKLPIPIYAAQQTLNELRQLDISDFEDEKPFFI